MYRKLRDAFYIFLWLALTIPMGLWNLVFWNPQKDPVQPLDATAAYDDGD